MYLQVIMLPVRVITGLVPVLTCMMLQLNLILTEFMKLMQDEEEEILLLVACL